MRYSFYPLIFLVTLLNTPPQSSHIPSLLRRSERANRWEELPSSVPLRGYILLLRVKVTSLKMSSKGSSREVILISTFDSKNTKCDIENGVLNLGIEMRSLL